MKDFVSKVINFKKAIDMKFVYVRKINFTYYALLM